MTKERRILLAVRAGEASEEVGRTAAWLARDIGAAITVLYIATELRTAAEVATGAWLDEAAVRERMRVEAQDRVAALARELLGDLPFDVVIDEGDVAERIAAVARDIGADLIVAGSQGRRPIEGVILGDTTQAILRRSPCPVVVVPRPARS